MHHLDAVMIIIGVRMPRRRQQWKAEKARRHAPPARTVIQADSVGRLAYSDDQAAAAIGVSRSTFSRRVLPFVWTIDTERGQRLIAVDELERYVAGRRQPATRRTRMTPLGRPPAVSRDVVQRIQAEYAAGKTLGQIARDLDADYVPTAQGGRRWWPSSVRAVLLRSRPPASA